jgi:mannose-6-phosphate isomerase-like protein (cupin superfamily)
MITGKVWGSTELILATPVIEIHRLKILPSRCCSMHKHKTKWNGFYVLSGRLLIETEKQDYGLTDVTELLPGAFTSAKPGDWHRFKTEGASCEALEIYWPETLSEDIVRRDVGGLVPPP